MSKQPFLRGLGIALGFLLFFLYCGLAIGTSHTMPENAIVFLNDQTHTYIAPPCVIEQGNLRVATASEAYELGYSPAKSCVNAGGFMQDGRSLTGKLSEAIGLVKPLPSRWNADGTWNW